MTEPLARLRADLDALADAYALGRHGRWAAHRRADLVDRALAALWERVDPPAGAALVALGGYGRRLQLPRSDIDLLLVHDELDAAVVQRLADAIWYPLWDSGFAVGHAVRTPAECLEAAGRFDAWTAMLDARTVAGDDATADAAIAPVRALAAGDPFHFARELRRAWVARRERRGSCAHLLEPDLKEGSGGMRDAASLGWLATAVGAGLVDAGLLTAREAAAADAAEDLLVRARSAVHLLTGRRADVLLTELQPEVAAGAGFDDAPDLVAHDALMRSLFLHARDVEHALGMALDRLETRDGPASSAPEAREPALSSTDAEGVLIALAQVAERGATPPAALMDRIADVRIADPVAWTPPVLDAFLRLLRAGEPGMAGLEALDRGGLLTRYLPCWADVRCRPQRDPYHRFTVDAHLTAATAAMAGLFVTPDDPDDPVGREAVAATDGRRDPLLLGALLHDIGKVGRRDHVPIGAQIAEDQLAAMGLDEADADLVLAMVADHLLLPDTATRRDLTEENLVLDVAARIGTPERLAALYLLAKADATATGPAAWTPWRRALIHELVAKVRHVLERGEMGQELAATLAERVGHVRELLASEPEADVDAFVLRMPRGYFLSVEPARAARHFRTIAPHIGSLEVRSAAGVGLRPGTYELLVVAADRPGLLASIAGALAVDGVSILSAQAFTTDDGVAVDLFEVEGAFEAEIAERRWRAFRTTLRRTIEGAVSLDRKVEEMRRHYPATKASTPVTVRADDDVSDFSTVIEVGAPDRIGLLFDITRTFAELGLDVHLAKVATFDGRVVDAFYVRDGLGRKVADPERLAEIERAMHARLG